LLVALLLFEQLCLGLVALVHLVHIDPLQVFVLVQVEEEVLLRVIIADLPILKLLVHLSFHRHLLLQQHVYQLSDLHHTDEALPLRVEPQPVLAEDLDRVLRHFHVSRIILNVEVLENNGDE
jgi:hypothetical protein